MDSFVFAAQTIFCIAVLAEAGAESAKGEFFEIFQEVFVACGIHLDVQLQLKFRVVLHKDE